MVNVPLAYSGLLGCTGVIAGAVGSHALQSRTPDERNAFLTGANYQLMHSMAALAATAFSKSLQTSNPVAARRLHLAAWMFLIGTSLFSGTIYARTFGAPKTIRRLAPLGGYIMMGGWLSVLAAALAL